MFLADRNTEIATFGATAAVDVLSNQFELVASGRVLLFWGKNFPKLEKEFKSFLIDLMNKVHNTKIWGYVFVRQKLGARKIGAFKNISRKMS